MATLEAESAHKPGNYWFGPIGHADIAIAAVLRFIPEAHPGLVPMKDYPALSAHCEALGIGMFVFTFFVRFSRTSYSADQLFFSSMHDRPPYEYPTAAQQQRYNEILAAQHVGGRTS